MLEAHSLSQADGEGISMVLAPAPELISTITHNNPTRILLADQAVVSEATNPAEHLGATHSPPREPQ